jgi:hypothetical protein
MVAFRMAVLFAILIAAASAHAHPWKRAETRSLGHIVDAQHEVSWRVTESPTTRLADHHLHTAQGADAADRQTRLTDQRTGLNRKTLMHGDRLARPAQRSEQTAQRMREASQALRSETVRVAPDHRLGQGLDTAFQLRTLDERVH